jgi:dethiobiotin synthetase
VAVFKPAVTGLDEGVETDHALLRRASGSTQSDEEIAPYRYGPPASPHLAAALAGEEIEPERLRQTAAAAAGGADAIVCEGVGGLLVPLSPSYLVRDLAADLGYPLVVVASPGLGTINHTLLTLEAARAAGLEVAAIVLTPWLEEPTAIERSNRETIAALGNVPVLILPPLDLADPAAWPALRV